MRLIITLIIDKPIVGERILFDAESVGCLMQVEIIN